MPLVGVHLDLLPVVVAQEYLEKLLVAREVSQDNGHSEGKLLGAILVLVLTHSISSIDVLAASRTPLGDSPAHVSTHSASSNQIGISILCPDIVLAAISVFGPATSFIIAGTTTKPGRLDGALTPICRVSGTLGLLSFLLLHKLVELCLDHMEDLAIFKFVQELLRLELLVIFFLEREDGQHLQERHIQILVFWVQLEALGDRLESLEVFSLAQKQLDGVQSLQKQVLVLLLTSQDLNKQLVAVLFDAEAKGLRVLKQFGENGVRVAKGSAVYVVVL